MSWVPNQGDEVQVIFKDGYVEVAKFIKDNDNGTCEIKIGRKQRMTVQNCDVYKNEPAYKRENRPEFFDEQESE